MCNFEFVVWLDVYTTWFVWKTAKTVKVDIAGASRWAQLTFLNRIVNKLEKFGIPLSLVLNLGQINSKYVYADKTTIEMNVPHP